jgi:uncharacterized membrane protein YedE/YeeE
MVAIATGLIRLQIIKKIQLKNIQGVPIAIPEKEKGSLRFWFGGIIFGLGWAMVGSCPGPIFILLGAGFLPMVLVLFGALLGTFIYGLMKDKLPH